MDWHRQSPGFKKQWHFPNKLTTKMESFSPVRWFSPIGSRVSLYSQRSTLSETLSEKQVEPEHPYYIFDLKSGQKTTIYTRSIVGSYKFANAFSNRCFCLEKRPSLIHFNLGIQVTVSSRGLLFAASLSSETKSREVENRPK